MLVRLIVGLLFLGALASGGWYGYEYYSRPADHSFRTAPVKRGDLVSFISATGTIEPEELVDVGAQVAGQIYEFGTDKDGKQIDYGSVVETDMILAKIDATLYAADLESAQALLALGKAGVTKSEADVEQFKGKLEQAKADEESAKGKLEQSNADLEQFNAKLNQMQSDLVQLKAKLEQAQKDWDRAKKLGPSEALSQESFDGYKQAFDSARANVVSGAATIAQAQAGIASGKAAVTQAKSAILSSQAASRQATAAINGSIAAVEQAKANVQRDEATIKRAEKNVSYCTIKSPVKGVIIDRRVNIGQTVVSSLNAPSLFLIAKDLTKLQVWVSVNEADIGNIHPQQDVTFLVDAFPGKTFKGKVGKVRLNATMTQNVVTYTVEVQTDNSNGKLLPYLTANAHFEVDTRKDVLSVPNAALRWTPLPALVAPDVPKDEEKPAHAHRGGGDGSGGGGGGGGQGKGSGSARIGSGEEHKTRTTYGKLWIQDGNYVRPIRVKVGISDGTSTEVSGDQLQEGQVAILGENVKSDTAATTNPFAPQPFARSRPTPSTAPGTSGAGTAPK